ncbi:hypothetical protein [Actinomycetospora sp. TBRC 11914]|uniref:hypothetical protein n=1 Tax=Actinomycetospora sp. TBRC 11914 TaxID=2729387 RepID=UPI00145F0D48|nr:hypothetical protein [Actinomycetospora sp. TBRC 11914]NMO90677.1 hypothetical protein [Actinomycetospora sp. TBRC 11914]
MTDAARFRTFARRHHPDVGGDPEVFRAGLEAFRAGRSPFAAVGEPDPGPSPDRPAPGEPLPRWTIADDDPRLDAPVVAVSGHVLPRTLRAGRRWLGRAPLGHVRTRRVV